MSRNFDTGNEIQIDSTFTCMTWCNVSIKSFKLSILTNRICCKNRKNCWECFCYSIRPRVQFCATHHTKFKKLFLKHNLDIRLFSHVQPSDFLFLTGLGLAIFHFIKISWKRVFILMKFAHGNTEAHKDKLIII